MLHILLKNLVKQPQIIRNLKVNLASATSISDQAQFPGYKGEFTTELQFLYPEKSQLISCYRVMNRRGQLIDESQDPKVI
jgi:hypothetical protein